MDKAFSGINNRSQCKEFGSKANEVDGISESKSMLDRVKGVFITLIDVLKHVVVFLATLLSIIFNKAWHCISALLFKEHCRFSEDSYKAYVMANWRAVYTGLKSSVTQASLNAMNKDGGQNDQEDLLALLDNMHCNMEKLERFEAGFKREAFSIPTRGFIMILVSVMFETIQQKIKNNTVIGETLFNEIKRFIDVFNKLHQAIETGNEPERLWYSADMWGKLLLFTLNNQDIVDVNRKQLLMAWFCGISGSIADKTQNRVPPECVSWILLMQYCYAHSEENPVFSSTIIHRLKETGVCKIPDSCNAEYLMNSLMNNKIKDTLNCLESSMPRLPMPV